MIEMDEDTTTTVEDAPQDSGEKSYYEQLLQQDVIGWLEPLWREKGWIVRIGDGKLVYPECQMRAHPSTPWHYTNPQMDCYMWSNVLFEAVRTKIKKNFAPSFCHQCFKVVCRPATLKGLFALETLQREMKRHSKCGIEVRSYVPALYGGYWYNRGLDAGRECYEAVRAAVDECEDLGPETPVILKRACTEMERVMGPSDKWKLPTVRQLEMERRVEATVVFDARIIAQPANIIRYVHKRWIEWAFMNGDETYKEYTGGKPIYGAPVTYHDQPSKEDNENG
jgi:hypothetical protein